MLSRTCSVPPLCQPLHHSILAFSIALSCAAFPALAQDTVAEAGRVEVLGSRIKKIELEGQSPVLRLTREQIQRTGLTSLGEVLQDLTAGGKALNSQFNSSGNFGAPPDGGGIGAGSAQVDLRHLESKRVLVLVDGKRWVNESSASGVGGAVDLNTIPMAIVETIEVLGDGASAVYGSDAIAGVVNIVTRKNFQGVEIIGSHGEFEQGDGRTSRAEITVGGGGERFRGSVSASYNEQQSVSSADRRISRDPPAGPTRGSPVTPQGRFIFVPSFATPPGLCPPTIDITGDGIPDVPLCDLTTPTNAPVAGNGSPAFPASFVRYTEDQSYNAQPDNLLLTPNKRKSVFATASFDISERVSWYGKALYNQRESVNQAAPNTIVIGPEAPGNGLGDRTNVSRLNPYNPFGVDLIAGVNMFAIARRPVEGGPRIFEQEVDTQYLGTGLEGLFSVGERDFFWDLNFIDASNKAKQRFRNAYNLRHIQLALGDPAACALVAGCVPLNLFGGQGPDGAGTLTPDMLAWIRTEVHDASRQDLQVFSANLSGDLLATRAGSVAFATGVEHRRYEGAFTPDPLRTAGEIFDLANTVPTAGDYEVSEAYAELSAPLTRRLDIDVALRYSDYSTFGEVTTGKFGFRWRPSEQLLVRGTYAEGFRAPFIGELHGLSQFGASIKDPCSGFAVSGNAQLIANCQALGVPASYRQLSSQVFTTTGGNPDLQPETSDSFTLGMVYSPDLAAGGWADTLDFELTYYNHQIDDAIQAPDAQDVLDACVASGDAASAFCAGIARNPATGTISDFDNRLANIGRIETDGFDFGLDWALDTAFGRFDADWQTTYVNDFVATDSFGNTFSRTVGAEANDGGIPRWQSNLRLGWVRGPVDLGWTMRYVHSLTEKCSDAFDNNPELSLTSLGLCSNPDPANPALSRNKLGATTYHDVYAGWNRPFGVDALKVSLGLNNAFAKQPPICLSCSLNGYDPGTYDSPGRFWHLQAIYRFQ